MTWRFMGASAGVGAILPALLLAGCDNKPSGAPPPGARRDGTGTGTVRPRPGLSAPAAPTAGGAGRHRHQRTAWHAAGRLHRGQSGGQPSRRCAKGGDHQGDGQRTHRRMDRAGADRDARHGRCDRQELSLRRDLAHRGGGHAGPAIRRGRSAGQFAAAEGKHDPCRVRDQRNLGVRRAANQRILCRVRAAISFPARWLTTFSFATRPRTRPPPMRCARFWNPKASAAGSPRATFWSAPATARRSSTRSTTPRRWCWCFRGTPMPRPRSSVRSSAPSTSVSQ